MKILSDTNEPDAYDNDDEYEAQIYLCYEHRQKLQKQMNSMYRNHLDTLKVSALIVSPNARAKGRGWTDYEKTHQIATPRPLERRVGPSLWEKKLGVAWLLLFFPYGAIRFTSIDTCWP